MARTRAMRNIATHSADEGAMRGMIAAGARAGNRVATEGGSARTNGGYIRRNRCTGSKRLMTTAARSGAGPGKRPETIEGCHTRVKDGVVNRFRRNGVAVSRV